MTEARRFRLLIGLLSAYVGGLLFIYPGILIGWIVGSSFGGGSLGEPAGIGIQIGMLVGPTVGGLAGFLGRVVHQRTAA
jgi:hypothetical protein